MHDTLKYMSHDPIYRKFHHNELTFRMIYAFHENFVLPLSHDEVVHGKGSLLGKMPGDLWQKFANMRLLYAYMYAQPAKKLLFMGGEFGQWAEWSHEESLEWHLLQHDSHRQLQQWVADLNRTYRAEKALHELDCDPAGFEWIDGSDSQQSMLSFMRKSQADPKSLSRFSTSRRCRDRAIEWAFRAAGTGRKFSTAIRNNTGERTSAILEALKPNVVRRTVGHGP